MAAVATACYASGRLASPRCWPLAVAVVCDRRPKRTAWRAREATGKQAAQSARLRRRCRRRTWDVFGRVPWRRDGKTRPSKCTRQLSVVLCNTKTETIKFSQNNTHKNVKRPPETLRTFRGYVLQHMVYTNSLVMLSEKRVFHLSTSVFSKLRTQKRLHQPPNEQDFCALLVFCKKRQ